MRKLGIIGFGWLASRIVEQFSDFDIQTTTTSEDKIPMLTQKEYNPTIVDFPRDKEIDYTDDWLSKDVIIVTVPFISKRRTTEQIICQANNICNFLKGYQGQLYIMSTIGIYGQTEGIVTEKDRLPAEVTGENIILEHFPQANILRLAGLMGDDRYLSKYNIKETHTVANHVHYTDIGRAIRLMIDKGTSSEVYNIVTPHHPTKEEILCHQKGLPFDNSITPTGKIVSTEKLCANLDFEYQMTDVREWFPQV